MLPLFIINIYFDNIQFRWVLLIIIVISGVSDNLDGFLARKLNITSNIGAQLDTIADKFLIVTVMLSVVIRDSITSIVYLLPIIIIVIRELLVFLIKSNITINNPGMINKIKLGLQIGCLGFLTMGHENIELQPLNLEITTILMLWLTAILTIISSIPYIKKLIKNITIKD